MDSPLFPTAKIQTDYKNASQQSLIDKVFEKEYSVLNTGRQQVLRNDGITTRTERQLT